jgi:hypothetical protein
MGQLMSDGSRFHFGPVCCVSSFLIFAFAPSSFALGNCAAYGPDFTLVEGTHSCVKIGGHVRVQFSTPVEDDHFGTDRLGPGATSATLRSGGLDGYQGLAGPRHMRVDTSDESYR